MKFNPAIQKQDKPKSKASAGHEAHVRAMLREGEVLKRVAAIHWGIYWKGAALLLIALFLMTKVFNLGAFLLFVASVILAYEYLMKYYILLALTDKRLIVRFGILNLETVQMHFNRIESVEIFRPPVGRMLGYATVVVTGTGSRVTSIPFVGDAEAFRADLDQMIYDREERRSAKDGG